MKGVKSSDMCVENLQVAPVDMETGFLLEGWIVWKLLYTSLEVECISNCLLRDKLAVMYSFYEEISSSVIELLAIYKLPLCIQTSNKIKTIPYNKA